ncbi:hypothetical protein Tco_0218423 [Tanacetum coccineum]
MSFHQALDLILELDKAAVGCTRDILRQRDCLDRLDEIPWVVPNSVVIEGEKHQDIVAVVFTVLPVERIEQGNEYRYEHPFCTTGCVGRRGTTLFLYGELYGITDIPRG